MAFSKKKLDPKVQDWLRKVAAEGRVLLYGEAAFPEWGTRFAEIERDGMAVGLELARLVMEQSVAEQARHVPSVLEELLDDESAPAGTEATTLETEAGGVEWKQPRSRLKRGRKAFFPPTSGAGVGSR
jgi:hypothetical protein